MKQRYLSTLPLLLLLILLITAGCTLVLDEYTVPEEEQGFDEPVTVESEAGSITYQYNEGVQPVTRNVQEYITHVEADTILYFRSDTPKKWLPVRGGLLAAGCTRLLPEGLNHRVLSVERTGDEYRVVTTLAKRQEVYKELKIKIETDYLAPQREVYDSLYLDSLGIDIDDLAEYDFSLVDSAYGEPADKAPKRVLCRPNNPKIQRFLEQRRTLATRAGNTKDKDTTITIPNLSIKFGPDWANLTLSGSISHSTHEHIYYEENQSADYKKSYTDDSSETTFDIKAEMDFTKDIVGGSTTEPLGVEKNVRLAKEMSDLLKNKNLPNKDKKLQIAAIKAIFPAPVPLLFVIKFEGSISFTGAIYGNAVVTYHHAKTRNGYIYENEEKTPIEETLAPAKTTLDDFFIGGQATLSAFVRAGIGIEIPGAGLGSTIGVGLKAGLEVSAQAQYSNHTCIDKENNYARAFIDFVADAEVYFAPLGVTIANPRIELINKSILNLKTHTNPLVDTKKTKYTYGISTADPNHKVLQYTSTICFSKLWTFNNMFHKEYTYPRVRVYHGSTDGPYKDFVTTGGHNTNNELQAEPDKEYKFVFTQDDLLNQEAEYIVVPCLYDALDDLTTEFRTHSKTYGKTKPKVTYNKYGQLRGITLRNYFNEKESQLDDPIKFEMFKDQFDRIYPQLNILQNYDFVLDNYYYYKFWFSLNFEHAPFIDQWGVDVEALRDNNKSHILIPTTRVTFGRGVYGTLTSGNKRIYLDFVSNRKSVEKGSDGISVRVRPFTISVIGEETSHSWTAWKDIYFNVYKTDTGSEDGYSATIGAEEDD